MMFINRILGGMLPFNDKTILKTPNSMANLRDTIRSRVDSRTTMLNYERRGCIRYKNYKRLKEVEDELIKIRILQDIIINDIEPSLLQMPTPAGVMISPACFITINCVGVFFRQG